MCFCVIFPSNISRSRVKTMQSHENPQTPTSTTSTTSTATPLTPVAGASAELADLLVYVPGRWGDMDAYGHVNNVAILSLMEEARVALFGPPPSSGKKPKVAPNPPIPLFELVPEGVLSSLSMASATSPSYLTQVSPFRYVCAWRKSVPPPCVLATRCSLRWMGASVCAPSPC